MFDTQSVFEVLAHDEETERKAARQALSLAQVRVENTLGRFLRGAVTGDQFEARLASCKDDFMHHVASASEEVGHAHPEHIARALIDHYANNLRWQPREVVPNPKTAGPHPYERQEAEDFATTTPEQRGNWYGQPERTVMAPPDPNSATVTEGDAFDQGFGGVPVGADQADAANLDVRAQYEDLMQQGRYQEAEALLRGDQPRHEPRGQWEQAEGFGQGGAPGQMWNGEYLAAAQDTAEQDDGSSIKKVTCPQCGGDGKTASNSRCSKCHGSGRVDDFGSSVLDAVSKVAADEGNTGLGGPEPKIDKRKWTPQSVGRPDDSSKRWPTKTKDPIDPIKAVNADALTEIGEGVTEHVDLPAASGDSSGFDSNSKPGPAPHTKTFPNGGQANPVTTESIS